MGSPVRAMWFWFVSEGELTVQVGVDFRLRFQFFRAVCKFSRSTNDVDHVWVTAFHHFCSFFVNLCED
jgi:hypothetical protein